MNTTDAVTIHRGFWCECWTESSATGEGSALLARFRAPTADQAVRWIRLSLRTMASALEAPAAERAWSWIATGYKNDVEALMHNQPCAVSIRYADTHVSWTARPVIFLPMAHPSSELALCSARLRITE